MSRLVLAVCVLAAAVALVAGDASVLRARLAMLPQVNSGMPACPDQPTPLPLDPVPQTLQQAFTQFDTVLKSSLDDVVVPGVAASIIYGGKRVYNSTFGTANKDQPGVPPTTSTIFRIGSLTKVLTSLMMFQLEFDDVINSINDPFSQYVPNLMFNNPFPSRGDVTWRNLATHMSGLPPVAPCTNPCNLTTPEIVPLINNARLQLAPNTVPSYSNLGYALLGRGLECVLGQAWEDYVVDNIFVPLGMNSSGPDPTPEIIEIMAPSYTANGSYAGVSQIGWQSPAGSAYSTVDDLSKFALELLKASGNDDGVTLPNGILKEWLEGVFDNADGLSGFGAPWEFFRTNNYMVRTKSGNIDGYSALLAVVPELDLAVTALWNGPLLPFNVSVPLFQALVPAFVSSLQAIEPAMPVVAPPSTAPYVGTYAGAGLEFLIVASGNDLVLNVYGTMLPMSYISDNLFQLWFDRTVEACIQSEFDALNGAYLEADVNRDGQVLSIALPGFFYGDTFVKSA